MLLGRLKWHNPCKCVVTHITALFPAVVLVTLLQLELLLSSSLFLRRASDRFVFHLTVNSYFDGGHNSSASSSARLASQRPLESLAADYLQRIIPNNGKDRLLMINIRSLSLSWLNKPASMAKVCSEVLMGGLLCGFSKPVETKAAACVCKHHRPTAWYLSAGTLRMVAIEWLSRQPILWTRA